MSALRDELQKLPRPMLLAMAQWVVGSQGEIRRGLSINRASKEDFADFLGDQLRGYGLMSRTSRNFDTYELHIHRQLLKLPPELLRRMYEAQNEARVVGVAPADFADALTKVFRKRDVWR